MLEKMENEEQYKVFKTWFSLNSKTYSKEIVKRNIVQIEVIMKVMYGWNPALNEQ